MFELDIHEWSAWAPGLVERDAWRAWAKQPTAPDGDEVAAATVVPPMLRRRLDPLGRAALQVAAEVLGDAQASATVFVSRRGDGERSLALLKALQQGEPLSPTSFGLSVHNAIAAQFSMLRQDRGAYSSLAAAQEGVESALLEIAAQLHDQPDGCGLLVVYEAPVPAPYQPFRDEPDARYAWAWRLGPPGQGGRRLCLSLEASADTDSPPQTLLQLPAGLRPLAHFLAGGGSWLHPGRDVCWRWTLDD